MYSWDKQIAQVIYFALAYILKLNSKILFLFPYIRSSVLGLVYTTLDSFCAVIKQSEADRLLTVYIYNTFLGSEFAAKSNVIRNVFESRKKRSINAERSEEYCFS